MSVLADDDPLQIGFVRVFVGDVYVHALAVRQVLFESDRTMYTSNAEYTE